MALTDFEKADIAFKSIGALSDIVGAALKAFGSGGAEAAMEVLDEGIQRASVRIPEERSAMREDQAEENKAADEKFGPAPARLAAKAPTE